MDCAAPVQKCCGLVLLRHYFVLCSCRHQPHHNNRAGKGGSCFSRQNWFLVPKRHFSFHAHGLQNQCAPRVLCHKCTDLYRFESFWLRVMCTWKCAVERVCELLVNNQSVQDWSWPFKVTSRSPFLVYVTFNWNDPETILRVWRHRCSAWFGAKQARDQCSPTLQKSKQLLWRQKISGGHFEALLLRCVFILFVFCTFVRCFFEVEKEAKQRLVYICNFLFNLKNDGTLSNIRFYPLKSWKFALSTRIPLSGPAWLSTGPNSVPLPLPYL